MGARQRCYYARYWQALSPTDGTTDLTLTKLEYWTQTRGGFWNAHQIGPDPPPADSDGDMSDEDGEESEFTTSRPDGAPYTCPTTKNGHPSSEWPLP